MTHPLWPIVHCNRSQWTRLEDQGRGTSDRELDSDSSAIVNGAVVVMPTSGGPYALLLGRMPTPAARRRRRRRHPNQRLLGRSFAGRALSPPFSQLSQHSCLRKLWAKDLIESIQHSSPLPFVDDTRYGTASGRQNPGSQRWACGRVSSPICKDEFL